MTELFDDGRRPEITYPCRWSYRVIGADEVRLRAAAEEVLGRTEHTLVLALQSSGGKYRSLELDVLVRDEAHRLAVFDALVKHPDVRFVI
ncbi:MAG: DUF493 domain-containing protein [Planctomycetes bacterium]|nr:DUF493 domain-containing protein [Planctomycetota bacterium]